MRIPKFQSGGLIQPKSTATRQDSLDVMQGALDIKNFYDGLFKKGYYASPQYRSLYSGKELYDRYKPGGYYRGQLNGSIDNSTETHMLESYKKAHNLSKNDIIEKQKEVKEKLQTVDSNPNQTLIYDLYPSRVDITSPGVLLDKRIDPQGGIDYNVLDDNDLPPGGSITGLPYYDPIAVAPWDTLSDADKKLRIQKYGTSGTPLKDTTAATKTLYSLRPAAPDKMKALSIFGYQKLDKSPHMKVPNATGRVVSTKTGDQFEKLVDPTYRYEKGSNRPLPRDVYESKFDPKLWKTISSNKHNTVKFKNGGIMLIKTKSLLQPANQNKPNLLIRVYQEGGELNFDNLKKGISYVESNNGKYMMNPTSTATGLYGQLYSEIKNLPEMQGITRDQFASDLELQDRMFEKRYKNGFGGPSLSRNAYDLTKEYQPQLGDKWNYRLDEVAALSNFLGRQGTRNYFSALRDGKEFKPPGVNKTPEDYLKLYNSALDESTSSTQN